MNIGIDHLGIPGRVLAEKLELSKSAISKLNRVGKEVITREKKILDEVLK